MTTRVAHQADFPTVWRLLRQAADWMMAIGRDQWDDKYPTREAVENDLQRGNGYLIESKRQVVAYTAISFDGEQAYDALQQGQWITTGPYAVVHRMAIDLAHRGKGYGRHLFEHAERLCIERGVPSIRVDTNHDNVEMLALIARLGYERCGKVCYFHGGRDVERIAFEKKL